MAQPHSIYQSLRRLAKLTIVVFIFSACSSNPVVVDYDTALDFSQFKYYRWATSEEINSSNEAANIKPQKAAATIENGASIPHQDLLSKRIKRTISASLLERNMRLNIAQPDFLIAHQITTQSNILQDTYFYNPFGIYLSGCSRHSHFCLGTQLRGESREYIYTELYLVLRLLNAQTQEVIWQGIVELPKNSSKKSAQEYDQQIQQAVEQLIIRFPPPSLEASTAAAQ